eukprot:scaffold37420_cov44-Cyclotella_meneghiniana.AAC.4
MFASTSRAYGKVIMCVGFGEGMKFVDGMKDRGTPEAEGVHGHRFRIETNNATTKEKRNDSGMDALTVVLLLLWTFFFAAI